MTPLTPQPHFCKAPAYQLFAQQAQDLDAEGALLRAAVAISLHDHPEVELLHVEHQLDQLANTILARVHSDAWLP